MNIHHVFNEIESVDPEVYNRMDSRRTAMKQFARISGKLALAAVPVALGGMFKKAYGQSTAGIVNVLQYALTLEYLEAEFYDRGVAAAAAMGLTGTALASVEVARVQENQHVAFLRTVISSLGSTPTPKPTFDFTAGNGNNAGPFANVFTNLDTFLAVAQTFEDTGVRAYKGRAAELIPSNDALTAALQIHSVEARHAAYIRLLRRSRANDNSIKPWITGNIPTIAAVQSSYAGEEVTSQAGINIVGINGTSITAAAASESFDEPLTAAQVLAIVDPFIV